MPPSETTPVFLELLRAETTLPETRSWILYVADIENPELREEMLYLARHGTLLERLHALRGLGMARDPRAFGVIAHALESGLGPDVRLAAVALVQWTGVRDDGLPVNPTGWRETCGDAGQRLRIERGLRGATLLLSANGYSTALGMTLSAIPDVELREAAARDVLDAFRAADSTGGDSESGEYLNSLIRAIRRALLASDSKSPEEWGVPPSLDGLPPAVCDRIKAARERLPRTRASE
jgi:hypothetical protein